MELTDEEKAALLFALETGRVKTLPRLIELGLIYIGPHPTIPHESKLQLTPAGQIVADLLKRESRLERAKVAMREWYVLVRGATDGHLMRPSMTLECDGLSWWVNYSYPATGERLGEHTIDSSSEEYDDPLTAVIEASKRTPWPLEE